MTKIFVGDLETTVQFLDHGKDNSPKNPKNKIVSAHWRIIEDGVIGPPKRAIFFHNEKDVPDTPDELKSRICSLLVEFIKVEIENKNVIDMPYEEIIKKVNRSKEREKKSIIDYLGKMSREERKVEELFKYSVNL